MLPSETPDPFVKLRVGPARQTISFRDTAYWQLQLNFSPVHESVSRAAFYVPCRHVRPLCEAAPGTRASDDQLEEGDAESGVEGAVQDANSGVDSRGWLHAGAQGRLDELLSRDTVESLF